MELEQDILVCKHWKNKGVCRMREICKFSHPVELCGIDKRDRMRVGTWQRKPVINDGRAGVLRRWLLSTFGESYLNSGSGILDVAGGKGEVSFELLNLNNIQCTVIDPRPLELDRFKRKLVCGFYHKNEMLNRYNSLPYSIYCTPIANEKASNCEKHHETAYNITNNTKVNSMDTLDSEGEKEQEPWKEALIHRYSNNCKSPRHIRLLFEMFLSYGKTLELPELKYKIPKALWDRKSFEIGLSYGKTLNNDGSKSKDKIVIDTNIENGNVPNNQERISNELNASIGTKSAKSVPFNEIECYEDALQIIQNCSVVVGMHPDQATEHLIEFCLRNKKPFAVFPCCVCYKQFQQRYCTMCNIYVHTKISLSLACELLSLFSTEHIMEFKLGSMDNL